MLYEARLKSQLQIWLESSENDIGRTITNKIISHLSLELENKEHIIQKSYNNSENATLLPLLYDLHKAGHLPAIIFNYCRADCEFLALNLFETLCKAEEDFKKSNSAYKTKLEQWKSWKIAQIENSKHDDKQSRNKIEGEELDREKSDASWQASFDPNAILPAFSFANVKNSLFKEMDYLVNKLSKRPELTDFISALSRGIAVHHSGMNTKYRQLVEILFRGGFLRVVVATGKRINFKIN